jgi:valyl-tRNA synthetase
MVPKGMWVWDRFEARKKILSELESQDLLVRTENITHSVPVDEKTKTVILEPLLTDQWYVDAATLAIPAIRAVEDGTVQMFPEHAKNTYFEWMRNIQPWCVSRQIWWGHQIPAWHGPDGAIFVAETEQEAQAEALKHYGEVRAVNARSGCVRYVVLIRPVAFFNPGAGPRKQRI